MTEQGSARRWTRHFLRREHRRRTTWAFRLGLVSVLVLALWTTTGWWSPPVARGLICDEDVSPSDALLVENFDPDYLVFERARILRRAGVAPRVLVPVQTDRGTGEPNDVALGFVEVMVRISRIGDVEVVPIPEIEPISLNAAYRIVDFLQRARIRSVTVIAPRYRSRRSELVYRATLGRAGIAVRCVPGRGTVAPEAWTRTWHGIQNIAEQWLKLQYYRFYVLPFRAARHT